MVRIGILVGLGIAWTATADQASAQGYRYGIESNGFYGGLSNLQLAPAHPIPSPPRATGGSRYRAYRYGGYPSGYHPYGAYRYPSYGYPYRGYGYGYGYGYRTYGTQLNVYPGGIIQTYRGPLVPRRRGF